MSTDDINEYFQRFEPIIINWINDSACTVAFSSKEVCQKAYNESALSTDGTSTIKMIGEHQLPADCLPSNMDP